MRLKRLVLSLEIIKDFHYFFLDITVGLSYVHHRQAIDVDQIEEHSFAFRV